jgi:hypothetical protein
MTVFADAAIEDLPDPIDRLRDAPQVIALKLMKRYLNLRYASRDLKRPPSVYLSKMAALEPTNVFGLCAQLEQFAGTFIRQMEVANSSNRWPDERNPRLEAESFNDRWPKDTTAMTVFLGDLRHLVSQLALARRSEFSETQRIFSGLFGERVSAASAKAYLEGVSPEPGKTQFERGRGYVAGGAVGATSAVARSTSLAPAHDFHPGILGRK